MDATLIDFFQQHIEILLLIAAALVEITPVKISPLEWLGKRLNGRLEKKVDALSDDLTQHKIDDWRYRILDFENSERHGRSHTEEEFIQVIGICDLYEDYIHEHHIVNGQCQLAIDYIKLQFDRHKVKKDFLK